MTHLLLITPGFHGYGDSIADAFRRIGYRVSMHCYDAVDSVPLKVWNKARYELPARVSGTDTHQSGVRVTRGAIAAISSIRPDVVLVIRGDVFTADFWEVACGDGRRVGVWLYDELRRTPRFDPALVSAHAALATYSELDAESLAAQGFPALHVRTGFDDRRAADETSDAAGLISFVGAVLPGRLDTLSALDDAGLPVKAWGRGWSDHPIDRARTWRLRPRGVPNARDVSYGQAMAIMRDSAGTLNIHGDQDGFTMRTYEACGVGGVQLIDRPDVAPLYEPGQEVLVYDGPDELIELCRRVLSEPQWFIAMRTRARKRTLAEHLLVHRVRELEALWQ